MLIIINENNTNQIKLLPDGHYPELLGSKFQLKIGRYLFIVPRDFNTIRANVVENYAENLKAQVSYVMTAYRAEEVIRQQLQKQR
jgi:hypothetical protein